ncbi:MAG: response regulator [Bdellovibrionaceae bacterium]|nr:response regulator [Pseudobdellovibrionaceae bacterium]
MKILLAEDDKHISTIAKLTLENIGKHQVTHVDNGEDALNSAINEKYDVILLDEMMPKMNGLKVCEEIRLKVSNPPPIIFLSAKSQTQDIEKFKNVGNGYIAKPFDPMTLCQQILDIVTTAGSRS